MLMAEEAHNNFLTNIISGNTTHNPYEHPSWKCGSYFSFLPPSPSPLCPIKALQILLLNVCQTCPSLIPCCSCPGPDNYHLSPGLSLPLLSGVLVQLSDLCLLPEHSTSLLLHAIQASRAKAVRNMHTQTHTIPLPGFNKSSFQEPGPLWDTRFTHTYTHK